MKTIVLCLSLLIACSAFAGKKENKEVKKVIQENIKLLENDDIKSFLTNIIHPEEAVAKKMLKVDGKCIERFKKHKKEQLLAAFKEAENAKPVFSSQTMVSYQSSKLKTLKNANYLNFKLYKGKWYLSNSSKNPVKVKKK